MRIRAVLWMVILCTAGVVRGLCAQTDWLSDTPVEQRSLGVAAEGLACASKGGYIAIATTRGLTLQKGNQIILDQPVGHLYSLDFSPDGHFLAAGGRDGVIRVWDVNRQEVIRTITGPRGTVASLRFSPDGRQLLSGSWDGSVILWSTGTWEKIKTLPGHTDEVYAVAFSPDGSSLASAGWDQTIKVWKGETSRTFDTNAGVMAIAFSPDGKYLAAGTYDGTVRIWEAEETGSPRTLSREVPSPVRSLVFSPDGGYLVSGHEEGSLRVLNVPAGRLTKSASLSGGAVIGLGFDRANRSFVTVSRIGMVSFWRESIPGVVSGSVDVDENIPKGKIQNPDAVAVVIGISQYQNSDVPEVEYARRDAIITKAYLVNTLGFDERRIIEVYNHEASLAAFKRVFEEQLPNWIRVGKSDVFVFYSGHGVPDPESKEAFLVPYDCNPTYAKSTGYRMKEFYDRLAGLKARSVTAVIEACFSGSSEKGMLLRGISPIFITVENPVVALENGVVFTASTGQQVASWYHEKKHGLFTYYFLKGLRGDADLNGDRQVTVEEMERYLNEHVPDQARYLNNREQTPQVVAKDKSRVLVRF